MIVGEGALREDLMQLSDRLRLSEIVEFAGFAEHLEREYARMDLFVLTSRDEGAPVVLKEAMAAGVPCVVLADGGGAPELVAAAEAGVVVPDEAHLAAEITSLLGDVARRREFATRGLNYAERELSPATWVRRYDGVYAEAVANHGRHGRGWA